MTRIHYDDLTLSEMVERSNAILVVKPLNPPTIIEKISISLLDLFNPPFQQTRFQFEVVEVLYQGSPSPALTAGQRISVSEADAGTKLHVYKLYQLEHVGKSPIYSRYTPSPWLQKQDTDRQLCFLRFTSEVQGPWELVAEDAWEAMAAKKTVLTLIHQFHPPSEGSPFAAAKGPAPNSGRTLPLSEVLGRSDLVVLAEKTEPFLTSGTLPPPSRFRPQNAFTYPIHHFRIIEVLFTDGVSVLPAQTIGVEASNVMEDYSRTFAANAKDAAQVTPMDDRYVTTAKLQTDSPLYLFLRPKGEDRTQFCWVAVDAFAPATAKTEVLAALARMKQSRCPRSPNPKP